MESSQNMSRRTVDVVELLTRTVYGAFLVAVTAGLLCLTTLVVAGTYAALHKGDDLPGTGAGGGGGRGGDVIMPVGW
jgi:hypothetical protein